jgi:hypothetical protein
MISGKYERGSAHFLETLRIANQLQKPLSQLRRVVGSKKPAGEATLEEVIMAGSEEGTTDGHRFDDVPPPWGTGTIRPHNAMQFCHFCLEISHPVENDSTS